MNNLKFKIIEPAELELEDAFNYYENEFTGLGDKFIKDFRNTANRIDNFPLAWTNIQNNIRKCRFEKFPFDIIYAIEEKLIIVIAIAHHHREPYYWIDRVV